MKQLPAFAVTGLFFSVLICAATSRADEAVVSGIRAFHWRGQTFVQWEERECAAWTTFSVYRSDHPITDVAAPGVDCLAREIIPRSGRSFFALKRLGFKRPLPCNEKRSTVIGSPSAKVEMTGLPLPDRRGRTSITGGIFVHTARQEGKGYYAVTHTPHGQPEATALVRGKNALRKPVAEKPEKPQPYLIDAKGEVPREPVDGKRLPFKIWLHAIAGIVDQAAPVLYGVENYRTYLLWMPPECGWREGLPTIFYVKTNGNKTGDWIELQPDDSNFAFMGFANTWWFGYNENILHPERMPQGVVRLYSQKKMRHIIEWLFQEYPVLDPATTEVMGPSMGGTGALLFGLRNPDLIAGIDANVPAGNLPKLPGAQASLDDLFGPRDADIRTEDGHSVWDELNNAWYVQNHDDLPFVRVVNTRYDTWMEWQYTVPFLRALDEAGHSFAAWWSPAGHNGNSPHIIPLFDGLAAAHIVRTDVSRPGISGFTLNDDCGDGRVESGSRYGGMNLQVCWKVDQDASDRYAVTFRPAAGIVAGFWKEAAFTFTPRRLQAFAPPPGAAVRYESAIGGKVIDSGAAKADSGGRLRVPVALKGQTGAVTVTLTMEKPATTP